jgi:outer membrane protein assembly factor BamD
MILLLIVTLPVAAQEKRTMQQEADDKKFQQGLFFVSINEHQKALNEFLKLEKMYPRHPYGEILPLRIQKCRNIIAEGELLIGKFYYKKGSYKAAIGRFEGIVKNYPDFKNLDETLYLLADSYKNLNMIDLAKQYIQLLKEKFPDSHFTKKAEGFKIQ